jgi:hypothetical protein
VRNPGSIKLKDIPIISKLFYGLQGTPDYRLLSDAGKTGKVKKGCKVTAKVLPHYKPHCL